MGMNRFRKRQLHCSLRRESGGASDCALRFIEEGGPLRRNAG
ncbi:unnamed protein product [Chondrus crispus]|uniref:Uncharacterized protein n=1 Tax=Chondrus crispus TaxID=2769 RepID=R7QE91_CHOCR|nr:unnamed protein product [Chondrus crispus]CDF36394.1 unnamed protein product [Chondrus crispus]|eukprot:XP_005716213.1 unnamed protein product [Chondrus crispus]